MNEHETDYPAVVVEIRSSSTTKGAQPGVTVRATSRANGIDATVATNIAWLAWVDIHARLLNLEEKAQTTALKASIEKEQADG